jgi:hypothetical protein
VSTAPRGSSLGFRSSRDLSQAAIEEARWTGGGAPPQPRVASRQG